MLFLPHPEDAYRMDAGSRNQLGALEMKSDKQTLGERGAQVGGHSDPFWSLH